MLVVFPASPPQFYNASESNVESEEGNFVTLKCIAIGYPIPIYTWSHGDIRVSAPSAVFKVNLYIYRYLLLFLGRWCI